MASAQVPPREIRGSDPKDDAARGSALAVPPARVQTRLEEPGVAVDLPLADRLVVLLPFGALVADELGLELGAEDAFDEGIGLEGVDRFAERARQVGDASLG